MGPVELNAALTEALDAILAIVAIYFSVVSAYIAALYYFLRSAPWLLKFVAFAFLTGALAFLGLIIVLVERLTASIVEGLRTNSPLPDPPSLPVYFGVDLVSAAPVIYSAAVAAGWAFALLLYAALFYLTFLHRWSASAAKS